MRDVVVIGGGLSGLSACYQLEKFAVGYTVIELKRRFGGTINSVSERGFVMDAGAFAFTDLADEPWLPALGLSDQLLPLDDDAFIFRACTESLTSALAAQLRGGRLMRMAVSSLGRYRNRFTICLENGLMIDAGAIILALPARYAARALYNLAPEAAERLAEQRYESVWQVALGVHKRELRSDLPAANQLGFSYLLSTDYAGRVLDRDHRLIQLAMPGPADTAAGDIILEATERLGITAPPIASRAHYTEESRSIHDEDHRYNMRLVRALLPAGISLVGSDALPGPATKPGVAQLSARMDAGRMAARAAVLFLQSRKSR